MYCGLGGAMCELTDGIGMSVGVFVKCIDDGWMVERERWVVSSYMYIMRVVVNEVSGWCIDALH